MLPALMAAMKGLAALPKLVDAVNELGERLNRVAADERLTEKKSRNRDAVRAIIDKQRVSGGTDGQRSEPHRPR